VDDLTLEQLDQTVDRRRRASAEIVDLAGARASRCEEERTRDVGHVDEVTTLRPIPDDRERLLV
jgi:hypothetical protein